MSTKRCRRRTWPASCAVRPGQGAESGDSNDGVAVREHIESRFRLCADRRVAGNTSCCVRVNDVPALRADLARRLDAGEVVETPWGMAEPHVCDPGGSPVKFGLVTNR